MDGADPMTRLLQVALRIGADPNDDEDDRLRKTLLLSVVLILIPVAAIWGGRARGTTGSLQCRSSPPTCSCPSP
jgi:hypothetical protein